MYPWCSCCGEDKSFVSAEQITFSLPFRVSCHSSFGSIFGFEWILCADCFQSFVPFIHSVRRVHSTFWFPGFCVRPHACGQQTWLHLWTAWLSMHGRTWARLNHMPSLSASPNGNACFDHTGLCDHTIGLYANSASCSERPGKPLCSCCGVKICESTFVLLSSKSHCTTEPKTIPVHVQRKDISQLLVELFKSPSGFRIITELLNQNCLNGSNRSNQPEIVEDKQQTNCKTLLSKECLLFLVGSESTNCLCKHWAGKKKLYMS